MHPLNTSPPKLKCLFMNQHVAKRTKGLSDFLWLCFLYTPLKQTRPSLSHPPISIVLRSSSVKILRPGLFFTFLRLKRTSSYSPTSSSRDHFVMLFSFSQSHLWLSAPHVCKTKRWQYTVSERTMQTNFPQCSSLQKGQFCFLLRACRLHFKDRVRFRRAFDACDGTNDILRKEKRPQRVWRSLCLHL